MIKRIFRRLGFLLAGIIFLLIILGGAWYQSDIPVKELEPKYFTSESSYIDVMDSKLHVRQRGAGPAIFLIHGSFASLHTWSGWEDTLSKTYRTISMDLPAHGLTGPNPSHRYSTDDYEKIVIALADALRIDTFFVAGNSMGGNIAWKMALHHPDRIKRLVLVDAAGFGRLTSDSAKSPKRSDPFIFKLLRSELTGNLLTRITPRFLVEWNMRQVYGDPSKVKSADVDRFYELMLREGNRKATVDRLRMPGQDLKDSIQYINVPTLILWGQKDQWIPVEHAYRFQKSIQHSILRVFPSAGHIPMEEIPQESVEVALAFFNSKLKGISKILPLTTSSLPTVRQA